MVRKEVWLGLFEPLGFWSFDIVSNFGFRASNLQCASRETIGTPSQRYLKAGLCARIP
jgi:hypothetical protein